MFEADELKSDAAYRPSKREIRIQTIKRRSQAEIRYKTPEVAVAPLTNWGLRDDTTHLGVGPSVDLSDLRASAHIDTILVDIRPRHPSTENAIKHALWRNRTITSDNRKGHRKTYAWAYAIHGEPNAFRVTIHDVTQDKLVALRIVLDELGGLTAEPEMHEIHFALDFKFKSKANRERFAVVLPMIVNVSGIDLTRSGTPRTYVGKETSSYPGNLHLRASIRNPADGETGADVRPKFYQYNRFLSVPGTTYFGSKNGDHFVRIYYKKTDKGQALPEERHVVREEHVFRGAPLANLGITTLESLTSLDAKVIARHFTYEIGRVPAEDGLLQRLRLLRTKPLMQAGAFAVRESEGGPGFRRPRGRKATVALSPLQKRASNAWRAFDGRWKRDAIKAHGKPEA